MVCGAPLGYAPAAFGAAAQRKQQAGAAAQLHRVAHIELSVWGCLDAGCAWREYAAGVGQPALAAAVAAFRPAAVLGVDWHSVAAYDQLAAALQSLAGAAAAAASEGGDGGALPPPELPPFVYLNYRQALLCCAAIYPAVTAPAVLVAPLPALAFCLPQ